MEVFSCWTFGAYGYFALFTSTMTHQCIHVVYKGMTYLLIIAYCSAPYIVYVLKPWHCMAAGHLALFIHCMHWAPKPLGHHLPLGHLFNSTCNALSAGGIAVVTCWGLEMSLLFDPFPESLDLRFAFLGILVKLILGLL